MAATSGSWGRRGAPHGSHTFTLADGTQITRRMGNAIFLTVIFGEKGDSTLLGTVSLESLGFVLDPIKGVLRPLPLVVGAVR